MIDDYAVGTDAYLMEQGETVETAEAIEGGERPFFSTPFVDYTVTEGLLLVLVLSVVAATLVKILKWGFSWLL